MFGIPTRTLLLIGAGVIGVMALSDGSSDPAAGGGSAPVANQCEFKVTADVLNVRDGPGTEFRIVGKLRQDAQTAAQGVVDKGFRKLSDGRWASTEFLSAVQGNSCQ